MTVPNPGFFQLLYIVNLLAIPDKSPSLFRRNPFISVFLQIVNSDPFVSVTEVPLADKNQISVRFISEEYPVALDPPFK